jgi:hypothetical protein
MDSSEITELLCTQVKGFTYTAVVCDRHPFDILIKFCDLDAKFNSKCNYGVAWASETIHLHSNITYQSPSNICYAQ